MCVGESGYTSLFGRGGGFPYTTSQSKERVCLSLDCTLMGEGDEDLKCWGECAFFPPSPSFITKVDNPLPSSGLMTYGSESLRRTNE